MSSFTQSPEKLGGERKLTFELAAAMLEQNTMGRLMNEESYDLEHEVYSVLSEMQPSRMKLFGRVYSSHPVMASGRTNQKNVWIREDLDDEGNLTCTILTPHFDSLPWDGYSYEEMPEFVNGDNSDLATFVLDIVCENRNRQNS